MSVNSQPSLCGKMKPPRSSLLKKQVSKLLYSLWGAPCTCAAPGWRSSSTQVKPPVKSYKDGAALLFGKHLPQRWRISPSSTQILQLPPRGRKTGEDNFVTIQLGGGFLLRKPQKHIRLIISNCSLLQLLDCVIIMNMFSKKLNKTTNPTCHYHRYYEWTRKWRINLCTK